MKVAITGATGFVGRHVVRAMLAHDVDIVAAARTPKSIDFPNDRVRFVPLDISEPADALEKLSVPDVLLHLAWDGLPNYRAPHHLESELPKQIAFLKACSQAGLKHLVVAGTCLEYGMQSGCLDEEQPTRPTTTYGQAKDNLRVELQALADTGGPSLAWLRLFYLYGPGQAPTSLYSQLRAASATGATGFPMSPGDQLRDFLPVETAASRLCALALSSTGAGIVNICSGVPRSVHSLARELLESFGPTKPQLQLGAYPYPDYEPRAFWGDPSKMYKLLTSA